LFKILDKYYLRKLAESRQTWFDGLKIKDFRRFAWLGRGQRYDGDRSHKPIFTAAGAIASAAPKRADADA
jgi:hypothetical protein